MKIAVSAPGNGLDAPFSPVFGRYPVFVIVDTDTMAFETIPNQAMSAGGGAGIQAAQDVAAHGISAVVTGSVGPNAYQVLAAAGISIYTFPVGTVRQAAEAYKAKQLEQVASATGPAHAGMGAMRGTGHGMGMRGGWAAAVVAGSHRRARHPQLRLPPARHLREPWVKTPRSRG